MIGPTKQDDIISLVLRFRLHKYILTGDIETLYRQFLMRNQVYINQKIIWRDEEGNFITYNLNTVTFVLSAAPFLDTRCFKQLADKGAYHFPAATGTMRSPSSSGTTRICYSSHTHQDQESNFLNWFHHSTTLDRYTTIVVKNFLGKPSAEIRERTPPERWSHIPTEDSPADAISRELLLTKLTNQKIRQSGSLWLIQDESSCAHLQLQFPHTIPESLSKFCFQTEIRHSP